MSAWWIVNIPDLKLKLSILSLQNSPSTFYFPARYFSQFSWVRTNITKSPCRPWENLLIFLTWLVCWPIFCFLRCLQCGLLCLYLHFMGFFASQEPHLAWFRSAFPFFHKTSPEIIQKAAGEVNGQSSSWLLIHTSVYLPKE